jgi:hypothetical protein
MAPDVRTVYVNVWKGRNGGVGYKYNISIIHETEQDAKVDADDCKDMVNFVAIAAPIEIEE